MKRNIRVIVPTIYSHDCPTVHSRLMPLCSIIAERGFEFTFLVSGSAPNEPREGISYRCYRNYADLGRMILGISKKDCDIILSCKSYSMTGLLPFIISKMRGLGYVLDVDDRIYPSEINKWWRVPLYVQEWLADRVLSLFRPPTVVASKALQAYYGKHSTYIPNSADLDFFKREKWPSDAIRRRFGISGPTVIWPAVFFQEIDRQYILDIFRLIEQKGKALTLIVLGEGEYLPNLKSRAREMGLSNIIFGGLIDYREMPAYYASADAGILPLRDNHYDACKGPIKLYEYMAMELPVIATPVGEPKEMILNADCGVLIPFKDSEGAANVIINLFEAEGKLRQLGRNGRAYLERFQSMEKQAERLEKVLLSVIEKKAGRLKECR